MNNTLLSVLLACIVLIQCKSIEQPESKADSTVSEVTLPTSPNQVNQSVTSDVITPLAPRDPYQEFLSRKDYVDVAAMIESSTAKMKVESGSVDMSGQIRKFSQLAQAGNREVESWLLIFYDDYFDALFSWNIKCEQCDGDGGVPHMFMFRFNKSLYRALRNIPPSIKKIELIMRLYKKESDTYWAGGDHDDMINGDKIVLNLLCPNITNKLCLRRGDIGRYNDEAIHEVQKLIEELYNQIVSGEVKLIDRETWKSM